MIFQNSDTDNRGNWERVEEGVGILEGNGGTVDQGPAIIDETVVVTEALEELGVDEACRAEPAASEVYFRDVATTDTHIHYLYCVGWNATWKRCCGALVDHYIRLAAFLTPYSVRFHSFISIVTSKKFAMRTSDGSFLRTTRHGHRHGYGESPTTTKTCQNGKECEGEDGYGYEDDDSPNRTRFHETNKTARRWEVGGWKYLSSHGMEEVVKERKKRGVFLVFTDCYSGGGE